MGVMRVLDPPARPTRGDGRRSGRHAEPPSRPRAALPSSCPWAASEVEAGAEAQGRSMGYQATSARR